MDEVFVIKLTYLRKIFAIILCNYTKIVLGTRFFRVKILFYKPARNSCLIKAATGLVAVTLITNTLASKAGGINTFSL
ncbi:MAG: hypothetical protein J6Q67_00545 [Clostridia bacterium]|nr:hypothetical protein [Clostridia bacterium]